MKRLYFLVSNHGFGHAARMLHLIRTLDPTAWHVTVNTAAPEPFVRSIAPDVVLRKEPIDFGVIQHDGIRMDLAETLRRLNELELQKEAIVEREAAFVRRGEFDLLVADLPFPGGEIAKRAGVRSVAIGNFGWDFIYRGFGSEFHAIADRIAESHRAFDLLLRLPFHEPMESFETAIDVGLVGGVPACSKEEVRSALSLPDGVPVFLITFGGMGLSSIPYRKIERFDGKRFSRAMFLTYDSTAPDIENLRKIDETFRPVDLMQIASGVITKPGYGILAEAYRVGCPVFVIEREGFAETPVLMEAIRNHFHHRIIPVCEFYDSEWEFLLEGASPPESAVPIPVDGNERCREILTTMAHDEIVESD